MKLSRLAGVIASVLVVIVWAGCGDVFRPVANPISSPGGDPQNQRLAVVLHQGVAVGGTCSDGTAPPCVGAAQEINVSGDTAVMTLEVGRTPSFAALTNNFLTVWVANQDSDTVSQFSNATLGVTTSTLPSVTTTSLPAGALPRFMLPLTASPPAVALGVAYMYVVDPGTNSVSAITPTSGAVATNTAVGSNPVWLAAATDGHRLYVVNQGSGTVSAISPSDNTVVTTIQVGTSPVAAVANPNGGAIYVLNQGSANVSIIDPATDGLITPSGVDLSVGAGANFMLFDNRLQRLYVANAGANSVTVFDVSQATRPIKLATVPVGNLQPPSSVGALHLPSLAVGAAGAKAYVVDAGETTGCANEPNMGRVTEINTSSFAPRCVTVGNLPVSVAASGDGSKVYVPHQGATMGTDSKGNAIVAVPIGTSIIATSTDSVVAQVGAPFTDANCTAESATCTRMTPTFVVTSP